MSFSQAQRDIVNEAMEGGTMNKLRAVAKRWLFSRATIATLIGTFLVGAAIGTALAAFGVATPFAPIYARFVNGNPQQGILSNQEPVTIGDTTIRLERVVASSSQTLVELAIDDPQFAETGDINAILPINPYDDINLSGFASNATRISQRSTMVDDSKRVLFDFPPLDSFDEAATIEIVQIRKRLDNGVYDIIEGPWSFTFVPDAHEDMRFSRRIQLSRQVEGGGRMITVEEVHLSATETVVSYATSDESEVIREPIGAPTLHYDGGVFKASTRPEHGTNKVTAHFLPLPEGVENFSVVFGPSLASIPEGSQVTLNLPEITEGIGPTLELDQTVTVDGASLRFTELALNSGGFSLTYEPADPASSFKPLTGPRSNFVAVDDIGVSHPGENRETRLDRETGALLWEQMEFSGTLDSAVKSITLEIDRSGRIDPPLPSVDIDIRSSS